MASDCDSSRNLLSNIIAKNQLTPNLNALIIENIHKLRNSEL